MTNKVMMTETSFRVQDPMTGIGTSVDQAKNSAEALKLAGLDWTVSQRPIYINKGAIEVPNYKANVRDTDSKVFGVVTNRYKVVQNAEAFQFTDYVINNELGIEAKYDSAGAFAGGKRVFMSARLETSRILGDEITPYMLFTNSHDGKGSIKVAITPVRIACSNMIAMILSKAARTWSTRHTGDIESKVQEAQESLLRVQTYMEALQEEADLLSQIEVDSWNLQALKNELFPANIKMTETVLARNLADRDLFEEIYENKEDLKAFRGTGWGVYNALADFESHQEPRRKTELGYYRERRFEKFIDGRIDRLQVAHDFLLKTA